MLTLITSNDYVFRWIADHFNQESLFSDSVNRWLFKIQMKSDSESHLCDLVINRISESSLLNLSFMSMIYGFLILQIRVRITLSRKSVESNQWIFQSNLNSIFSSHSVNQLGQWISESFCYDQESLFLCFWKISWFSESFV